VLACRASRQRASITVTPESGVCVVATAPFSEHAAPTQWGVDHLRSCAGTGVSFATAIFTYIKQRAMMDLREAPQCMHGASRSATREGAVYGARQGLRSISEGSEYLRNVNAAVVFMDQFG
jgi:hypothetical protein